MMLSKSSIALFLGASTNFASAALFNGNSNGRGLRSSTHFNTQPSRMLTSYGDLQLCVTLADSVDSHNKYYWLNLYQSDDVTLAGTCLLEITKNTGTSDPQCCKAYNSDGGTSITVDENGYVRVQDPWVSDSADCGFDYGDLDNDIDCTDYKYDHNNIVIKEISVLDGSSNVLLDPQGWTLEDIDGANNCGLNDEQSDKCNDHHIHKHISLGGGDCYEARSTLTSNQGNKDCSYGYTCYVAGC